MSVHRLKIWPAYFDAVLHQIKTFEYRKDDRQPAFAVGDTLALEEWEPAVGTYTGRKVAVTVTYIARAPLIPDGFAVMSIRLIGA